MYSTASANSQPLVLIIAVTNLFCTLVFQQIRMRFEETQSNRYHAIATFKASTCHSPLTAKTTLPCCLPELNPAENNSQPILRF